MESVLTADKDLLSFTAPFEMFLNMEKNVPDSF